MAQIDFIATRNDSIEILESIAEFPNVVFLVDKLFESPSCSSEILRGPNEIKKSFEHQLFFWTTDTFLHEPKLWSISQGEDAGKYRLRQAENETIMNFLRSFEMNGHDDRLRIYPGMIGWDTRWLDYSDGMMKPLKDSAKRLISNVRRIVRKKMTLVNLEDPIFVGREALRHYQNGKASLMCCGKEFSNSLS